MHIPIPSSKSITQRAIAAALLSNGASVIENFSECDDTTAALRMAQRLGAKVYRENGILYIEGNSFLHNCHDRTNILRSCGLKPPRPSDTLPPLPLQRRGIMEGNLLRSSHLHSGESALALRMFAPIAALSGEEIMFIGEGSLLNRPVDMIVNALEQGGVKCTTNDGKLPLTLSEKLKNGHFHIDGSVTSQILTGLLMALPVVEGDSVVVVENLKSKPYIDLTMDVLQSFGIEIENNNYHTFFIRGNQRYSPCRYVVEGDWSSAVFWLVAGAIYKSVSVSGLNPNSKQADRAILDALKLANCTVECQKGIFTSKKSEIAPFTFDASDYPDLIPILTLLAACAKGVSKIYGAYRLAFKESDRTAVLIQQFAKAGISLRQNDDILEITGGDIQGCTINPHNDHRIAMTFGIASLVATSEIMIENKECVRKSYPDFWKHLRIFV